MATYVEVSDPEDPRLADYRDLRDVQLRQSLEAEHGLFLAEGEKVVRRAAEAGYPVRSFLMAPRWLEGLADVIEASDAPCYVAVGVAGRGGDRLPRAPRRPGLAGPDAAADGRARCSPEPAPWWCARTSSTTRTSARSSDRRPRSASTASCSLRVAPTRCTGARSRSRWVPCSPCPGPGSRTGTTRCRTSPRGVPHGRAHLGRGRRTARGGRGRSGPGRAGAGRGGARALRALGAVGRARAVIPMRPGSTRSTSRPPRRSPATRRRAGKSAPEDVSSALFCPRVRLGSSAPPPTSGPYEDFVGQVRDYAIIGLDPQGVIESWNLGAERVKGYPAKEAIGRSFGMFYTEEDRRARSSAQPADRRATRAASSIPAGG